MKKILKFIFFIQILLFLSPISVSAQTESWKEIGQMEFPVSGGQIIFNNSLSQPRMYLLGGYSHVLQQTTDIIQEYNPITNELIILPLPARIDTARQQFVAVRWDSLIVYFGGAVSEAIGSFNYITMKEPVKYGSDKNFNRQYSSAVLIGNELYIISGISNTSEFLPFVAIYDLIQKQITYEFSFPPPVFEKTGDGMTFTNGSTIYIAGGVIRGSVTNTIRMFETSTKTLDDLDNTSLLPRAGAGVAFNPLTKNTYIVGGYDEVNYALKTVEKISFGADGVIKITPVASLKYARRHPLVACYDNKIYVFGGQSADKNGVSQIEVFTDSTMTDIEKEFIPTSFSLEQNYPNPFNPETTISYKLQTAGYVTLKIYDMLGRDVMTLVDEFKSPGIYQVHLSSNNHQLTSGIYFYTLRSGNSIDTKKMMLLR